MQPVVSVLRFTASACPSKERKLTEAVRLVSEIDGAQQGCWGFEVGKCNSGCIVQVWQSLQHHKELLHHANFSGIRDALAACFSEQPTLSHVVFDNKSTALDQPVLHILRAQTPLAHSEMECKIRRIVDKIGKTAFGGQSLENPDVHFVFIGTATVERRNPKEHSALAVAELSQVAVVEHSTMWLKSAVANPLKRAPMGGETQGSSSVPFTGKSTLPVRFTRNNLAQ